MSKISIILPSYNRADMISDAIDSILRQTCRDWEIIVVDDGSRDNTGDVVRRYSDPRIRYIYQENKGLPGARNTGLRAATGAYVAFLDSDDAFLPDKLSRQSAILDAQAHIGLVAGGFLECDRNLRVLREMRPWQSQPTLALADWLLGCPFCPGVPLVRREWLDRAGLFDESMRRIEDWDLWLRMSFIGCQMEWLQEPVCCYRYHGGNMVRDVLLMKAGMLTMFDKLFVQPGLSTEAMQLRGKAYANAFLNAAARAFAAGDPEEGRVNLESAVRLDASWLAGNPPRFLGALAAFALSPLCKQPDSFMAAVMANLPDNARLSGWTVRRARALLSATAAFEAAQQEGGVAVINHALAAIVRDPGWLTNRGLLVISGRAFLGRMPSNRTAHRIGSIPLQAQIPVGGSGGKYA